MFTFQGTGQSLFDFDSWQFSEAPTAVSTPKVARPTTRNTGTYDLLGRKGATRGVRIENGRKKLAF